MYYIHGLTEWRFLMKTLGRSFFILFCAIISTVTHAKQSDSQSTDQFRFTGGDIFTTNHPLHGIVKYDFRENGYVYGSHSSSSDSGKWEFKDGTLCSKWRNWNDACGTITLVEGKLIYKKTDGSELVFFSKKLSGCDASEAVGGTCPKISR